MHNRYGNPHQQFQRPQPQPQPQPGWGQPQFPQQGQWGQPQFPQQGQWGQPQPMGQPQFPQAVDQLLARIEVMIDTKLQQALRSQPQQNNQTVQTNGLFTQQSEPQGRYAMSAPTQENKTTTQSTEGIPTFSVLRKNNVRLNSKLTLGLKLTTVPPEDFILGDKLMLSDCVEEAAEAVLEANSENTVDSVLVQGVIISTKYFNTDGVDVIAELVSDARKLYKSLKKDIGSTTDKNYHLYLKGLDSSVTDVINRYLQINGHPDVNIDSFSEDYAELLKYFGDNPQELEVMEAFVNGYLESIKFTYDNTPEEAKAFTIPSLELFVTTRALAVELGLSDLSSGIHLLKKEPNSSYLVSLLDNASKSEFFSNNIVLVTEDRQLFQLFKAVSGDVFVERV